MYKNSGDVLKKTNKRQAVALSYDSDDGAPKIVAAGTGEVAERIIKAAEGSGVPLHQDSALAQSLSVMHIGQEIPPELYTVVAKILLFVSDIDSMLGDTKR